MISVHAVIFMLRKVESISDVNRGPEPCQSGTALTFPVLCLAYTQFASQIDGAVRVQSGHMRMCMTTIAQEDIIVITLRV